MDFQEENIVFTGKTSSYLNIDKQLEQSKQYPEPSKKENADQKKSEEDFVKKQIL